MRQVTFSQPMAPFGVGDQRLVPDDVAKRLHREGVLSDDQPFPAQPPARAPTKPVRPILHPTRPAGAPDRRLAE